MALCAAAETHADGELYRWFSLALKATTLCSLWHSIEREESRLTDTHILHHTHACLYSSETLNRSGRFSKTMVSLPCGESVTAS